LIYQILGYEPVWAFTKVVQMSETIPSHPDEWTLKTYPDGTANWLKVSSIPTGNMEEVVAAVAGPLLGLLSAVLGLVMSRRSMKVSSRQVWIIYVITISLVAVPMILLLKVTRDNSYTFHLKTIWSLSVMELNMTSFPMNGSSCFTSLQANIEKFWNIR